MMNAQANMIIQGKVQGVWYRQSTKDVADRLGLTGWVRNLPNGFVEARVVGERSSIEELIAWCHQGPAAADVGTIDIEWQEVTETFNTFSVR